MADRSKGHRNQAGGKAIETIEILSSDEGDGPTIREIPESSKQKRYVSATKNTPSQKRNATNSDAVDLTSTHSGSASPHSRSQRSKPATQNITLAQRHAMRHSESHERSSSRQPQRVAPSSSGRASSPPASQVQIPRGLKGISSVVRPETNSTNGSQGASVKLTQKKRSLERDDDDGERPAAKRLKSSQGYGQSSKEPQTAKSSVKKHNSSGNGNDSNPIVISDSPPPASQPKENAGHSSSASQMTSKQSKTPATNGVGKTPIPAALKAKSAKISRHGKSSRDASVDNSIQTVKSPTIPESLPGSPEMNRFPTSRETQGTALPLFFRPTDKVGGDTMGADNETISSFAEQAEELLASQADDTSAGAAAMQDSEIDDNGTGLPLLLNGQTIRNSAMPLPSPSKEATPTTRQDHGSKVGVPTRARNTAVDPPPSGPAARLLFNPNSKTATLGNTTPANHIEQVINKYLQELRDDNMYWTRTWLKRARHMVAKPQWSGHAPTSVFRDMKPLEPTQITEDRRVDDSSAKFTVETSNGGSKSSKRTYFVPCTMYSTPTDADVPNYSHFVNIKHSFLARNETILQHWPYFGDDFDMEDASELARHYYMDVNNRERKIKRLAQAENFAEYVEDMLRDIGCTWSDVLRFLLDPEPDVGTTPEALTALRNREKFCEEDFVRGGQRWTTVLSKLPTSNNPEEVGRAALFCEYFQKIAKFPLWQVARRSDYTAGLLAQEDRKLGLDEITCRVCMRFNCPYHGEIHEHPHGGSDSERDGSADEDVVETDIIHPLRVNYRSRVEFPPSVDTDDIVAEVDSKCKKLGTWVGRHLHHLPDERRGPFYPCYHPGSTCEKTQCSCFVDRIPCEKSCACPPSCKRKWRGCDCRKKGGSNMICFDDSRCVCFQMGRECDADLCGDCGVSDVLDPVHRHDEGILRGRCHNANIQRGVPRHTVLGDSGIHGLGLYACEDIQTHDFVGEYKGEIITKDEAERRGAVYQHQKLTYLFSLNKKQEVDSALFGNKIRFINHATGKQANLYPRIIMVNTVFRIALYGQCKIKAGQELLFDYGDQFPQDQLGGKPNKERKAAPHLHNQTLVADFDEVEESIDKFGNRRARKAASNHKRGKLPSRDSGSASTGAGGGRKDIIARKSAGFPSGHGGPRSGAGRPRGDRLVNEQSVEGALQQDPLDDMDHDAGHRLSSYNVAEDDDDVFFPRADDDEEDDDFAPQNEQSSDDRNVNETSSVDGGDEDEDDDDDEVEAMSRSRPRSSRPRNGDGRRQR